MPGRSRQSQQSTTTSDQEPAPPTVSQEDLSVAWAKVKEALAMDKAHEQGHLPRLLALAEETRETIGDQGTESLVREAHESLQGFADTAGGEIATATAGVSFAGTIAGQIDANPTWEHNPEQVGSLETYARDFAPVLGTWHWDEYEEAVDKVRALSREKVERSVESDSGSGRATFAQDNPKAAALKEKVTALYRAEDDVAGVDHAIEDALWPALSGYDAALRGFLGRGTREEEAAEAAEQARERRRAAQEEADRQAATRPQAPAQAPVQAARASDGDVLAMIDLFGWREPPGGKVTEAVRMAVAVAIAEAIRMSSTAETLIAELIADAVCPEVAGIDTSFLGKILFKKLFEGIRGSNGAYKTMVTWAGYHYAPVYKEYACVPGISARDVKAAAASAG